MSTRPGADARYVQPAERGDSYYSSVIGYLRVIEVLGDGRIIAITPNKARFCFLA